MGKHREKIGLINCISGRGHLDAYARLYVRALLELDYEVVLIAKQDGGVVDYLDRNADNIRNNFKFLTSHYRIDESEGGDQVLELRNAIPIHRKLLLIWRSDGLIGIIRRLFRLGFDLYFKICRKLLHRFSRSNKISFEASMGGFSVASNKEIETIDLFLHLYLDFMSETAHDLSFLNRPDTKPWAGILFHPRLLDCSVKGPEKYLSASSSTGAFFLIPSAIPLYKTAFPSSDFFLVPDVADLEMSIQSTALADQILVAAAGRKIIILIGSISPKKGILTFLDVVALADPSSFFFAIVGEVHWDSFGNQEEKLRKFYNSPPENVFIFEGYVREERDYNALLIASDIIYCVYKGFNSSSNSLTKAAGFKRPILVSEKSLMAERVSKAGIGTVVPENSPVDILNALRSLAYMPREHMNFDTYSAEHSLETLKNVLKIAIPTWMNKKIEN